MRLPRLYPIADVSTLRHRGLRVDAFVRMLVDAGVEIVQLRDKDSAPQEVLAHAAQITEALTGSSCLPVMNDRADLALLAGWRAVHVGHTDMSPDAVRRIFGAIDALVGVSTHNPEQIMAADAGTADYVAVGPVYATGTKLDAEPVIGLEGVRRARALTRKPLVAIGGITRANAVQVMEAGADSVAVIGGLFAPDESVADVARDFFQRLR